VSQPRDLAGARRIIGLETEYGCLVTPTGDGPRIVHQIRDWIFDQHRFGLIDLHERDWDQPPGNGGFLFNGGRLYIDMGHLEYCTPECASLADVVRYDRAGDRLLQEAIAELGLADRVQFIRNNVDHHSGATFGCHENYSLLRRAPLTEANVLSLLTFLTLRVLFTGAGRVGSAKGPPESGGFPGATPATTQPPPKFQISQRADYIQNDFYEWVQRNRAIINTRDEPLADPEIYRRLHLIHGDTNVLPAALFLKVGSTRLMLDLLEHDDLPAIMLGDAVGTLRALSHQPRPPWRVTLAERTEADPVEILSRYRQAAVRRFTGRDAETDEVLRLWERVEQGLAGDLTQLVGVVDWVTKHHLLSAFRESEGLTWHDPWMEAQDLEYHQIDPARGLGLALADLDGLWGLDLEGPEPLHHAPAGTRAILRSLAMRRLADSGGPYEIDWHVVQTEDRPPLVLLDPFQTEPLIANPADQR